MDDSWPTGNHTRAGTRILELITSSFTSQKLPTTALWFSCVYPQNIYISNPSFLSYYVCLLRPSLNISEAVLIPQCMRKNGCEFKWLLWIFILQRRHFGFNLTYFKAIQLRAYCIFQTCSCPWENCNFNEHRRTCRSVDTSRWHLCYCWQLCK